MNGDGWKCDECGLTVVVSGIDRLVMGGRTSPPAGWFLLFESSGPERGSAHEWHFCCIECVMNGSTKQEAERAYEQRQKAAEAAISGSKPSEGDGR